MLNKIRSTSGVFSAYSGDAAVLHAILQDGQTLNLPAENVASRVFASESIDSGMNSVLEQASSNMSSMLASVRARLGMNNVTGQVLAAENAAITGAFALSSLNSHAARETSIQGVSFPGKEVFRLNGESVPHYAGKRTSKQVAVMEAFDQREQRQSALYTFAYNYTMPMQGEFGDALYPLLTLPANEIGFGIVVNRLTIHKGMTHQVSGLVQELQKIDLTRAPVDHTVLSRKKNRAIPVYRAAAADKFSSIIPPRDYQEEGMDFKTAPLKIGVENNIMGLSQTDAQLALGAATQVDTIDPAAFLDALYVKFGDDIVRINTYSMQSNNFAYNQQGRPEDRRLNFRSKYVVLTKATKNDDDSALVTLKPLVDNSLSIVLDLAVDGTLNTEFNNLLVHGPRLSLVRVLDENNEALPTSDPKYQELKTIIDAAVVDSYDVRVYKVNAALRENGDFIDRSQFVQLYEVPLLSPITAQRPVASNGEFDTSDYEALVQTTRYRLIGDVVTSIFEFLDQLRAYTQVPFNNEDAPSGLGAARFHVKPYLAELTGDDALDMEALSLTLDSKDAARNLAAALTNKLRDMAFSMYVLSEFESARMALGLLGGIDVIIATDPYIRRYLQLDGEVRPLSEKFTVHLVDTLDKRFRGKILMVFGVFDASRNETPNILNWGNLVWASESVVSANIPRGNGLARETIVMPRYRFVEHCPVATLIEVKNMDKVFNENYVRVKQM